ncbi:MAG: hypothetical protein U0Q55_23570 [Vicinamibacterales bacterium]
MTASHDAQFVVVAAAEGVKAALAINQAPSARRTAAMSAESARFVSQPEAERPPPAVLESPTDAEGPLVPVPVDMRNAAITLMAVDGVLLLQHAQSVFIPLVPSSLISGVLTLS